MKIMKNLNLTTLTFATIPEDHNLYYGYPKEGPFVVKTDYSTLYDCFKNHPPFHVFRIMSVRNQITIKDVLMLIENAGIESTFPKYKNVLDIMLVGRCTKGNALISLDEVRGRNGRKVWALQEFDENCPFAKRQFGKLSEPKGKVIRTWRKLPREYISNLEAWA